MADHHPEAEGGIGWVAPNVTAVTNRAMSTGSSARSVRSVRLPASHRGYRFDGADPHRTAKEHIRHDMEPSTFVFWTATAADLPISWDEVRRRLAERRERPARS